MSGFDQTTEQGARPPWKIVALVAGAVLVGGALVFGAVLFVRSRQRVEIASQNMDRILTQVEASLVGCAQEPDPDACRKEKVLLASKATGAESLCDQLGPEARDSCVWTIARERIDPEICVLISDSEKATMCAGSLYTKLALSANDSGYCKKISDSSRRDTCVSVVNGPLTSANCAERGNDASTCDRLAQYESVVATKNPAACETLPEAEDQARCQDALGAESPEPEPDPNADTDGDGLTDAEETGTYHTDPTNADTDGDGYSDKAEIDAGYNPSGEGMLAAN